MTFKEFKDMVNSLDVPDDLEVVYVEPYDDYEVLEVRGIVYSDALEQVEII